MEYVHVLVWNLNDNIDYHILSEERFLGGQVWLRRAAKAKADLAAKDKRIVEQENIIKASNELLQYMRSHIKKREYPEIMFHDITGKDIHEWLNRADEVIGLTIDAALSQ